MLRTLFTPRWLALLAVLVAILVVFTQLGLWQLSVARDDAAQRAADERATLPTVAIDEAIAPHQGWADENTLRPVSASGIYLPEEEFLVASRVLEGQAGFWVVTPLQVESTQARLAVVRGFVTDPAAVPTAPPEQVTVTGALAPGESPARGEELPAGQRGSIDLAELVNEWPGAVYNGFVLAADEQVQGQSVAEHPQRIPPPAIGGQVDWRNLGYALQWWVFGAFAVFMYWKLLREDHLRRRGQPDRTVEPSTTVSARKVSTR